MKKYLIVIHSGIETHIVSFRAKNDADAMKICDKEANQWVKRDYHELFIIDKTWFLKGNTWLQLPIYANHVQKGGNLK